MQGVAYSDVLDKIWSLFQKIRQKLLDLKNSVEEKLSLKKLSIRLIDKENSLREGLSETSIKICCLTLWYWNKCQKIILY